MSLGALPVRPDQPAAGPEQRSLEVAGRPVAYRRAGAGEPVLYLHGSHFAESWLPFHERLAEAADLVYPLHPGIAEAEVPGWLEGFDDLVLHYRDLLDALGLRRAHLVGHALGGWIAADLAVFYPERVASLALLAPAGLRVPGSPMADYLGMAPERVAELLFNGDPGPHAALLPDPKDRQQFARAYGQAGVSARLIWNRRYDLKLERRLPRVAVPALVVTAEEDRVVPNAHAARWAELLPDARLETVAGTGHAFLVQAPERTADLVVSHLRGAPS